MNEIKVHVERNKALNGPTVRRISSVGKEKVLRGVKSW